MRSVETYSAILLELQRAKSLHPKWPDDLVHQVAIVSEEVGELVRSANRVVHEDADPSEIMDEAIQAGAMIFRFLENFHVLKPN